MPFSLDRPDPVAESESDNDDLIALLWSRSAARSARSSPRPFSAGVVVLLYTDRRIRAEAFDLVLQTGAAGAPGAAPDSTDHLWLTRQPDVPT